MRAILKVLLMLTFVSCSLPNFAQNYFSWDNATVYFVLTDRFNNVVTANDFSYGRSSDPVGGFLGGDLAGLTQKINEGYFDDLGVNAIWITPPYEQIHGAVPGYGNDPAFQNHYAYHGYYALDFTEIDANYGTASEFETFVDAAHAHGIRIVMDIVLNHVGYDNQADVSEFGLGPLSDPTDPGWCNWWTDDNGTAWIRKDAAAEFCCPASGGDDLTLALAGLPDIRTDLTTPVTLPKILQTKWDATKEAQEIAELNNFFSNTGLSATPANYLVKWLTDWVREYGVDVFRIDTYKHVERSIWGDLKTHSNIALEEWKTNNPTKKLDDNPFWMVGEWYGHGPGKNTDAVVNGQTDALINFNFQGQAGTPVNLEATYSNYASIVNPDPEWNILSYISSHDTELFDRNDLIDGGTALLLAPGAIQIFYGDETQRPLSAYNTGSDQDTRSFMNWNSINNAVLSHWQKMGKYRQAHPAIGAGTHNQIMASPYIFKREYVNADEGICDVAVVALGLTVGANVIDVSTCFEDGDVIRNFYTDEMATVSNGVLNLYIGTEQLALLEYVTTPACISLDISPVICADPNPVVVTIDAVDVTNPNSTIITYYSFDPNATTSNLNDWTIYNGPFTLSQSATVYAFAINSNNEISAISNQSYTIGSAASLQIAWNAANAGCTDPYVYIWEIDGIANTEVAPWPGFAMTNSNNNGWYEYTLNNACSAMVIFSCNGGAQTADLSVTDDACYDNGWVACPTFSPNISINPAAGQYPSTSPLTIDITLNNATGCDIYYTLDGSTPTPNNTLYTGSFNINGTNGNTIIVNAVAYCNGSPTPLETATYTFNEGITIYWDATGSCETPFLYAFSLNGVTGTENAPWPGEAMSDSDGDGWYALDLIGVDCTNLIFNCGSNQNQTGDFLNICQDTCYQGSVVNGGFVSCPPFDSGGCEVELMIHDNPILSAIYNASQRIYAHGIVDGNGVVRFEAGVEIDLEAGFEVKLGAEFDAVIEDCDQ